MSNGIPTAAPDEPTQGWSIVEAQPQQGCATIRIEMPGSPADSNGIPVLLEEETSQTHAAPALLSDRVHDALLDLCQWLDNLNVGWCVGTPDIFTADVGSARAVSVKFLVKNLSRFQREVARLEQQHYYPLLRLVPDDAQVFARYFYPHLAKIVATLPPLPDSNSALLEF